MKIIHIESGLGNQMLSYCEYLALKKMNPDDEFYLETIIYDIPECNEVTCQWNGYELKRIFGIKEPRNVRTLFSAEQWQEVMYDIRQSVFWKRNWNYPVYFTKAFNRQGLNLENIRGDFDDGHHYTNNDDNKKKTFWNRFVASWLGTTLKRYYYCLRKDKYIGRNDRRSVLFMQTPKNLFTGQWLSFKLVGNERWRIDDEIRSTFVFPPFTDDQNRNMADILDSCNGVAIHARRGDMLAELAPLYKHGYFRRAVKHIKHNVNNPVFIFFTNTGSIDWCRENEKTFGLDYSRDKVYFVDWNAGEDSFRDMQLIGHCKHAIITNSSFGWWGAFFIQNPGKITISPSIEIDTTFHC